MDQCEHTLPKAINLKMWFPRPPMIGSCSSVSLTIIFCAFELDATRVLIRPSIHMDIIVCPWTGWNMLWWPRSVGRSFGRWPLEQLLQTQHWWWCPWTSKTGLLHSHLFQTHHISSVLVHPQYTNLLLLLLLLQLLIPFWHWLIQALAMLDQGCYNITNLYIVCMS